jgi:hypothetical protein
MKAIVPIGGLFAITLWLSNAAYLYLSVSFIQASNRTKGRQEGKLSNVRISRSWGVNVSKSWVCEAQKPSPSPEHICPSPPPLPLITMTRFIYNVNAVLDAAVHRTGLNQRQRNDRTCQALEDQQKDGIHLSGEEKGPQELGEMPLSTRPEWYLLLMSERSKGSVMTDSSSHTKVGGPYYSNLLEVPRGNFGKGLKRGVGIKRRKAKESNQSDSSK